jgi:hypothetical protein
MANRWQTTTYEHPRSAAAAPPRRQVWSGGDEEVVLPRGRSRNGGGALMVSALLATALVAFAAFTVHRLALPSLAETRAEPLEKTYEPDALAARATMVRALTGPVQSTPPWSDRAQLGVRSAEAPPPTKAYEAGTASGTSLAPADTEAASAGAWPSSAEPVATEERGDIDDLTPVLPGAGSFPGERPVYPNPTTTPPEMVAPTKPETTAPSFDSNPY